MNKIILNIFLYSFGDPFRLFLNTKQNNTKSKEFPSQVWARLGWDSKKNEIAECKKKVDVNEKEEAAFVVDSDRPHGRHKCKGEEERQQQEQQQHVTVATQQGNLKQKPRSKVRNVSKENKVRQTVERQGERWEAAWRARNHQCCCSCCCLQRQLVYLYIKFLELSTTQRSTHTGCSCCCCCLFCCCSLGECSRKR